MTLDQLRYFCAAAELQHIGKAAQQENISQPSLSIAIKKLEAELEVPLFVPNGRGIVLTEQGAEFLQYVRSILQQTDAAVRRMREYSTRMNTEIRVAYTASLASGYIPQLFKSFLEGRKDSCLIYSDEIPSKEIMRELLAGNVDIGICARLEEHQEIVQIPILFQKLVLILPEQMEWDGEEKLAEHFAKASFVSYRENFPMNALVDGVFKRIGIAPNISHFAYSEEAIARLVEQNLGISIVAKTDNLNDYKIRVLHPAWLGNDGRENFLTYHRLRHHGKAVREMMSFIIEHREADDIDDMLEGKSNESGNFDTDFGALCSV